MNSSTTSSAISNDAITIQVAQPKVKKPAGVSLEGYVEVIPKWLKLFQGTWVKYSHQGVPNSGGNLVSISGTPEMANLRSVRGVVSHVPFKDTIFYVKHDSPLYSAYTEVLAAVKR